MNSRLKLNTFSFPQRCAVYILGHAGHARGTKNNASLFYYIRDRKFLTFMKSTGFPVFRQDPKYMVV